MQINEIVHWFKWYFLIAKWNKSKSYKSVLSTINLLTESMPVENITDYNTPLLQNFLVRLSRDRCWSPKTYRNHWQNLKSFFAWCETKGYIKKNPLPNVPRPKLLKSLPRFIASKDVKTILISTEYYPWRYGLERSRNVAILAILLFSWIRLQEMLNLTVGDVNLLDRELYIKKGKWGKDRIVPIHNVLLLRLQEYSKKRKAILPPSPWFFTSVRSCKQLTQKNILHICSKIRKVSKVYFSPHMLRHTFARMAVEAEVNLFTIKEVMGHSNISTTQRYLSISMKAMKKQICEVDFLVWL